MPSPLEMAGKSPQSTTGGNSAVSLSILDTGRKRRSESSRTGPDSISGSRKSGKVSRACDYCKSKKLKCSGTVPCTICSKRELACQYHSLYRRGRPPTPPRAPDLRPHQLSSNYAPNSGNPSPSGAYHTTAPGPRTHCGQTGGIGTPIGVTAVSEHSQLESTEIEGQIVDSTSNLNFMHRAWRRLALQTRNTLPSLLTTPQQQQSLTCAGDRPFTIANKACIDFRDTEEATAYLDYYFDNCVVTYRLLHRPTCRAIRDSVLSSAQAGQRPEDEVGHAKVSLISCIFAIAILRKSKLLNHDPSAGVGDRNGVASAIQLSEQYFENARRLSQMETGYPKLESVQSRILQVLYLLQTSRMNQAWYIFGTVITILSALGLHRKATKQGSGPGTTGCSEYIATQCSRRTFWVVYTIDKYLAVVFGRPRFLHDDEINQDFPDLVNDEDMRSEGPADTEPRTDCNVDSLIFHARIARIIGSISRDVYSLQITSDAERLLLAERYTVMLREWLHELPPHLGSVRPSSLIPSFRRQCMALKLAYSHAVMHANRPFLLETTIPTNSLETERRVEDCMGGAKMALETVEHMVSDGSLFHSLWWTPYVAFCALAVVYVWEIQHRSTSFPDKQRNSALLALAERCQGYLTQSLPDESLSRRYGIILEELRLEAKQSRHCDAAAQAPEAPTGQQSESRRCLDANMATTNMPEAIIRADDADEFQSTSNLLSQWQPTDWLDLDSSVLNFFNEVDGSYPLV